MSKRLETLKSSLEKKTAKLDSMFDNHFADVRSANGQPLNDKRNGQATLNRWGRQNDSIRNQQAEVEKTKTAIDREAGKISETNWYYERMPSYVTELIDSGVLVQWRKHPRMMFVNGVDKARLAWDEETDIVSHRYVSKISDKSQFEIFRDVFNGINKAQREALNM